MFQISSKTEYGLVLMLELAKKWQESYLSLADIGRRQGISSKYLAQLAMPLRQSGLLMSKEGAHGGYQLAKSPENITILQIMEALEGPVQYVWERSEPGIAEESLCQRKRIWPVFMKELTEVFAHKTLAELLKDIQVDCLPKQSSVKRGPVSVLPIMN